MLLMKTLPLPHFVTAICSARPIRFSWKRNLLLSEAEGFKVMSVVNSSASSFCDIALIFVFQMLGVTNYQIQSLNGTFTAMLIFNGTFYF